MDPTFAQTMKAAIHNSGLSLRTIRSELEQRGSQVGIATLSSWQNGTRSPVNEESILAIEHLEDVLGVERGQFITQQLTLHPAKTVIEVGFSIVMRALKDGLCRFPSAHSRPRSRGGRAYPPNDGVDRGGVRQAAHEPAGRGPGQCGSRVGVGVAPALPPDFTLPRPPRSSTCPPREPGSNPHAFPDTLPG